MLQILKGERDNKDDPKDYSQRISPSTPGPRDRDRPLKGIHFLEKDGLIYHLDPINRRERLCIPKAIAGEVFHMAHDGHFHARFNRTYERLRSAMFIQHLSKLLRTYIAHYPQYLQNRTERHQPYGSLEPIAAPDLPHEMIAIDLVTSLPASNSGHDVLITATCKRTKHILLTPGQNT